MVNAITMGSNQTFLSFLNTRWNSYKQHYFKGQMSNFGNFHENANKWR